jgi:hypothetical protein
LKEEEKLARKQIQKNRGRCPTRGKGQSSNRGRFQTPRDEGGSSSSSSQSLREESRGRNFFSRGRGRGGGEIRCYTCGKTGHMSWDCLENKPASQRNVNIAEDKEENVNVVTQEQVPEVGECCY